MLALFHGLFGAGGGVSGSGGPTGLEGTAFGRGTGARGAPQERARESFAGMYS